MELKFIRLRGYHPRHNPPGQSERYRTAKQPVEKWQSAKGLSEEAAREWLAEKGWLGLVVPDGYIIVDIDDDATGRLVKSMLENVKMGEIKTPRGWQYIFADAGLVKSQSSGYLTACGIPVDYRLPGRGYIVYPAAGAVIEGQDADGRRWEKHPAEHNWRLDPMPFALKPLWSASSGSFDIPINEGARDDTLFKHACRLRKAGIEDEDLERTLQFVNEAFCLPPLPSADVLEKCKSARKYPVAEIIKIDKSWEQMPPKEKFRGVESPPPGTLYDASDLLSAELPPIDWVLEGILPEGLAIIAGPPKMGKSWAVLSAALMCATGGKYLGKYPAKDGDVLYLALEDNQRRMKARIDTLMRAHGMPQTALTPGKLAIAHDWVRIEDGGAAHIEQWAASHTEAVLVIIDTFQKLRGVERSGNAYQVDYQALDSYKKLADRFKVSVLLVHHFRKGAAEDVLELFSGSFGLTGAADTLIAWTGKREHNVRTLSVTGRDIALGIEEAVRFEPQRGLCALGDAQSHELRETHKAVLAALEQDGPMSLQELATHTGKNKSNLAARILPYLIEQGSVAKRGHGMYDSVSPSRRDSETGLMVDAPAPASGWWLDG